MSEAKVETTAETIVPKAGDVYEDAAGRVLTVEEVNLADPLGRQVVGRLFSGPRGMGAVGEAYSTTLQIWKAIWLDKTPARTREPGDLG